MEIYDALRIAVGELEKSGQLYAPEYRLTANRSGAQWVFWFVFLPEKFGSDVTVLVGDDGSVQTTAGF